MIESINFTVKFPPTDGYPNGRDFDRQITFEPGMTNIIGPNESGKSLVVEMIEFLLFGSKALRGRADDYRHLKASGTVVIRGQRYWIERTHRNAALHTKSEAGPALGEQLVVGTKPVNAAIIQRLGYGLGVFRVANVANQGRAEWLAEMKPEARKAMVDRLVGAEQLEGLAKWCGEQALGVAREITGLRAGLTEPVEPRRPDAYHPAETFARQVDELRAARDRGVEIRAFLANAPDVPALPERPTNTPLATLEKAAEVLALPTYDYDLAEVGRQWVAWDRREKRGEFLRLHPQPVLLTIVIDQELLRRELTADIARLRKSPVLTCPCGKTFTSADAEIESLTHQIALLPVLEGKHDLDEEARRARDWNSERTRARWEEIGDAPDVAKPTLPRQQPAGSVHVDEQHDAIRVLGINPDLTLVQVRTMAQELRAWEAKHEAHYEAETRRGAWERKARDARKELSELRDDKFTLTLLESQLDAARLYEAQLEGYAQAFVFWEAGRNRLATLVAEEESWREAKSGFDALRQATKNYILPALAAVASARLQEMTGGARGRVVVDEDFEVEVDGQALNTLSGSGKVCANLAIRFGLGRILTNGVFPVFIGDEMDASMDEDRVEYLHHALLGLQDKLTQTIIITHKGATCPNVVDLGV